MESGERAPLIRNLRSSSRVGIFTTGETNPGLSTLGGPHKRPERFSFCPPPWIQPRSLWLAARTRITVPKTLYVLFYVQCILLHMHEPRTPWKTCATYIYGGTCIPNICMLLRYIVVPSSIPGNATLATAITNVEFTITTRDILHLTRCCWWWFTFQHI